VKRKDFIEAPLQLLLNNVELPLRVLCECPLNAVKLVDGRVLEGRHDEDFPVHLKDFLAIGQRRAYLPQLDVVFVKTSEKPA
jgi:hypothetical protein